MKIEIIIYLLLNSFFLSYVRLRDTGSLNKVPYITRPLFIVYIGILAIPLNILYMIKNKIIK